MRHSTIWEPGTGYTLQYTMLLHHTKLYCTVLYTICYAMLYTIHRYIMPYYAMPCLCYAILYYTKRSIPLVEKLSPCQPWAIIACCIRRELFEIASSVFFFTATTQFSSVTVIINALIVKAIRNPFSECTKQQNTVFHHCPSFLTSFSLIQSPISVAWTAR